MSKCDNCRLRKELAKAFDIHWLGEDDCPYDKCPVPDLLKTNGDRIRDMGDEELAEFLRRYCRKGLWECDVNAGRDCAKCWIDWLKQEASDETD